MALRDLLFVDTSIMTSMSLVMFKRHQGMKQVEEMGQRWRAAPSEAVGSVE